MRPDYKKKALVFTFSTHPTTPGVRVTGMKLQKGLRFRGLLRSMNFPETGSSSI